MNHDWQEFLKTKGVTFNNESCVSFSTSERTSFDPNRTYLCELSNLGLIKAGGEDALKFLHSQFTNDLNLVTDSMSQLSSYCNPKGRILAIFRIFRHSDEFFLLMPRTLVDAVVKKLTMFKLMAKVDLEDVSDDVVIFGIAGPDANSILEENNLHPPEVINQLIQDNDTTIIRIPSETSRLLSVSNPESAMKNWNALSEKTTQANSNIWELHDIQSGIPQITIETFEAFTPQMVNLELIGGVNFQKGCYPGQEVVARTHYLGKPNRRMYRLGVVSNSILKPSNNIYSVSTGEQPVGKIVTAHCTSENIYEVLAVLRTDKETVTDLYITNASKDKVSHQQLPYLLDTSAE